MQIRSNRLLANCLLVAALLITGFGPSGPVLASGDYSDPYPPGKIVVADRASGTISVVSARTGVLLATVDLPPGDNAPEPMYVVPYPAKNRVFVGDRANDRVVAFDSRTFEVVGTAQAGAGVFHMWGSNVTRQLWVNCDIDNTMVVIDMRTLDTVAVIEAPADLVAQGAKPHDVFVSPDGFFAYVSFLGIPGGPGYVVQYDALTREEIGRAMVGDDPHLSMTLRNPYLYVPAQGSGMVHVLDRFSLAPVTDIPVPGGHGAGMTRDGRYFYTTNLPGSGTDALWTIDTTTNTLVGDPVDTPYEVPHNIALTPNGRVLFVTHSGENDKVTIYRVRGDNPVPEYAGEVTVGLNPFGLAYIR